MEAKTKVGVLVPLSGDFKYFGEIAKQAIEGQKQLRHVSFDFEDSACDAKKALGAYRKFSELQEIRYFLGPCCGNELESIAPVLAGENKLVLSLCSSTGELFLRSKGKLLSPVFSIEAESAFMAAYFQSRGFRKVAVVYFNNSFSIAHEAAFRRTLKEGDIATYTFDAMDPEAIRSIVLKLRQNPPDAVYVPDLTPFLLSFAKQLRNAGLKNLPIFSIHAAQTGQLIDAEGEFAEGIVYSHPDTGDESADTYYARVAANLIDEAAAKCGDDVDCSRSQLLSAHSFAEDGTMTQKMVLRTVKNRKFVSLTSTD